jgi:hypothetical protein
MRITAPMLMYMLPPFRLRGIARRPLLGKHFEREDP